MARTYLIHLDWALTADPSDRQLRDATLVVEDDRILAVGSTDEVLAEHPPGEADDVRDARRYGVTPGFVDTHVHLSETLSRAVFPDNLATRAWVFHWAKPFYAHVGTEDESVSVLLGTTEMLRCGTTCFLDMGAQNDPGVTARAAGQTGIRGITGRHAADNQPKEIPAGWSEEMVAHHFFPNHEVALEVLEQCVRDWNGYAGGRIRCWVNIEGKEPCTLELHVGARALSERLGVGTTYHIASNIEESQIAMRRYGRQPVQRIAEHDGLGSNLVLAHAVAVDDGEVDLMAGHGTGVAFCPSTSLKIAKGATSIGKYPEMLDAGVTVGVGTDGVSAARNMNLMRQMYLVAQAEQGGYWQAQAADTGKTDGVSFKVLQGGPQIQTIPQVAAGKADFGVAQADELMLARAQGVPVVEVFGGMDKYLQCMMYHPAAGIKDFSDINGHQVAVAPSGGFWPYLKGKYKLDNVKEINFTGQLAEFKRNPNLVQQCFITSEPYFAKQQKIDNSELLVADAGYNPYSQGLFTSERFIREHPDTVKKVVAGVQKGWESFLQDPTAARDLVMKTNKDMEKGPFDFAWKTLKDGKYFGSPLGGMTEDRWTTLHDQLKEAGVLDKDVDPSTVWTDKYVPKG